MNKFPTAEDRALRQNAAFGDRALRQNAVFRHARAQRVQQAALVSRETLVVQNANTRSEELTDTEEERNTDAPIGTVNSRPMSDISLLHQKSWVSLHSGIIRRTPGERNVMPSLSRKAGFLHLDRRECNRLSHCLVQNEIDRGRAVAAPNVIASLSSVPPRSVERCGGVSCKREVVTVEASTSLSKEQAVQLIGRKGSRMKQLRKDFEDVCITYRPLEADDRIEGILYLSGPHRSVVQVASRLHTQGISIAVAR